MLRAKVYLVLVLFLLPAILGLSTPTPVQSAIAYDLVAEDIEVTQTIQDLDNSLPLVEGKRTFVRVYGRSPSGTVATTAQLRLQKGDTVAFVYPIAPGGPKIYLRPTYSRLIPTHAFLFEIPSTFTSGTVQLSAEINPSNFWWVPSPVENNYQNNKISTQVSFTPMPTVWVAIGDQPYFFPNFNTHYQSSFNERWMMFKWIKKVYPLNQTKIKFFTMPEINARRSANGSGGFDLSHPSCSWLNAVLYLQKKMALWNGNVNSDDPYYQWYAMVTDQLEFMRGCGSSKGTSSGPTGDDDHGWDFDGTYGDWYGGHEVIHTFGVMHTLGGPTTPQDSSCGTEPEGGTTVKQHTNGWISPTVNLFSPQAVFGFDSARLDKKQNPILGPNWRDVMTYCDYQWISDLSYKQLMILFQFTFLGGSQVGPQAVTVGDRLGITGTLYPATRQGILYPGQVFYQVPDSEPRVPGPFNLELLDGDGNVLASYPFTPEHLDSGASIRAKPSEEALQISELVPFQPGTQQVDIVGPDGSVWASRSAGANPPSLEILSPQRGDIVDTPEMRVAWDAADADGDPVTVNVEYSPDNGNTWHAVGLFLSGSEAVIPADNLPAGDTALVRLTASDGIHGTTRVMTGTFSVPNHEPTVEIISPQQNDIVASGQTLSLEGFAYDIETGTLDNSSVTWTSNRDGLLGNGASLTTSGLSAGMHTITLAADDGSGGQASATVDIEVVLSPDRLPALPDGLVVSPQRILLEPSEGLSSTLVSIENQNFGVMPWSVVSVNQPWLQLSASSGSTPDDIQVTLDLGLLRPGNQAAQIVFGSGPVLRQSLDVVVLNPEYRISLPMVVR